MLQNSQEQQWMTNQVLYKLPENTDLCNAFSVSHLYCTNFAVLTTEVSNDDEKLLAANYVLIFANLYIND